MEVPSKRPSMSNMTCVMDPFLAIALWCVFLQAIPKTIDSTLLDWIWTRRRQLKWKVELNRSILLFCFVIVTLESHFLSTPYSLNYFHIPPDNSIWALFLLNVSSDLASALETMITCKSHDYVTMENIHNIFLEK